MQPVSHHRPGGPGLCARDRIRTHSWTVALVCVCAAIVYAPLLIPGRAPYSPFSDIPSLHMRLKQMVGVEGGPPLWATDQLVGAPGLGNPQALAFHPLHLLFWWLSPERAFGPTFVLELMFGALGAYAFALSLGRSVWGARLAACAQLVCFKWVLACFAGWVSLMAPLVCLPWVCAGMCAFAMTPSRGRALAMTGGFAIALSGGAPQPVYYALLLLWPLLAWVRPCAPLRTRVTSLSTFVGSLCLATACSAYLWLPALLDLPRLTRAQQNYTFFLSGHALSPRHLLTLFDPEILGTTLERTYPGAEMWEDVAYIGVLPLLALAFCFVRFRRLHPLERYLGIALLVSVALSLESPLLRFAHASVPGYALFRLPGRMLFVSAVLAYPFIAIAFDLLSPVLARTRFRPRWVALVLTVGVLLDGALYARSYLTTIEAQLLVPDPDHPLRALPEADRLRVAVVERGALNYGWSTALSLQLVNGYDSYCYAWVSRYLALVSQGRIVQTPPGPFLDLKRLARPDLLQELSVGYVVSKAGIESEALTPPEHFTDVRGFLMYKGMRRGPLTLQRLRSPRPRARFATEVIVLADQQEIERALSLHRLEGQAYVLPSNTPGALSSTASDARVQEVSWHNDRVRLKTHSSHNGLLLLSQAYHPGFVARVDGKDARPLQANLALLGLPLGAGSHDVELWFDPPGLRLGKLLSLVGLGLLTLLSLLSTHRALRRHIATTGTPPGAGHG